MAHCCYLNGSSANLSRIHVFADLKPYICTFSSCPDELCTFPTRQLWADHEFRKHRIEKYWRCYLCSGELSSISLWGDHRETAHKASITDELHRETLDMACCFRE